MTERTEKFALWAPASIVHAASTTPAVQGAKKTYQIGHSAVVRGQMAEAHKDQPSSAGTFAH